MNKAKLKTEQGRLVLQLNVLPQYITLPDGIRMNQELPFFIMDI
jgi:hypothetical protein